MDYDKRSPFQFVGPYMATIVVLGITIPALLYSLIMVLLGWRNPAVSDTPGPAFVSNAQSTVYLYESPSSGNYFANVGGSYDRLLTPWRNYFTERNRPVKSIKSPKALTEAAPAVLVLPSAVALSAEERQALLAFRNRGGSILSTWASGARDDKGTWLGWNFLEQLGASGVAELPKDNPRRYLSLIGELPGNATQQSGLSIKMDRSSESLLSMRGKYRTASFTDRQFGSSKEANEEGAIVYSENERLAGRSVAFAFSESHWESQPFVVHGLIDDAISWLGHELIVVKSAWPNGLRSAQVISVSAVEKLNQVKPLADLLHKNALPATFFVGTSEARTDPLTMNHLVGRFEVAFSGDNAQGFHGQDPATQQKRFSTMRNDLGTYRPRMPEVKGFRAPDESSGTLAASFLLKNGVRYYAIDPNRSQFWLPYFVKHPDKASKEEELLLLPRHHADSTESVKEALNGEHLSRTLVDEFHQNLEIGALGWTNLSSLHLGDNSVALQALPSYLSHLKKWQHASWITDARTIEAWWRQREQVKVNASFDGRKVDLNITINGDQPVRGLSLTVLLPSLNSHAVVQAVKVGTDLPEVKRLDDFRSSLVFTELKPGNHNYTLSSDKNKVALR